MKWRYDDFSFSAIYSRLHIAWPLLVFFWIFCSTLRDCGIALFTAPWANTLHGGVKGIPWGIYSLTKKPDVYDEPQMTVNHLICPSCLMIMFIMTTQNVSLKYVCTISHPVPTTPLPLITVGRSEFSISHSLTPTGGIFQNCPTGGISNVKEIIKIQFRNASQGGL